MEITKNALNYACVYKPNGQTLLHEGFVSHWSPIGDTGAISIKFVDGYKVMTNTNNMFIEHRESEED